MPKKTHRKLPSTGSASATIQELQAALMKQKKADLVEFCLQLARKDTALLRQFMSTFQVSTPRKDLVATIRRAIVEATEYDDRDLNRNFYYNSEAYEDVQINLGRLIQNGEHCAAMELALELMEQGSEQVEASDEGLMTEDIEHCLSVVILALPNSDRLPRDILAWCKAMREADQVGFISEAALESLRKKMEARASK